MQTCTPKLVLWSSTRGPPCSKHVRRTIRAGLNCNTYFCFLRPCHHLQHHAQPCLQQPLISATCCSKQLLISATGCSQCKAGTHCTTHIDLTATHPWSRSTAHLSPTIHGRPRLLCLASPCRLLAGGLGQLLQDPWQGAVLVQSCQDRRRSGCAAAVSQEWPLPLVLLRTSCPSEVRSGLPGWGAAVLRPTCRGGNTGILRPLTECLPVRAAGLLQAS